MKFRTDELEKNAVIIDKQGIFGNYGWDEPIGNCGLIVWDENGNIVWKSKYLIYDCYAMNVDDRGNRLSIYRRFQTYYHCWRI